MYNIFFDDKKQLLIFTGKMKQRLYTLIADSGSTKCDWVLLQGEKTIQSVQTLGFNPYVLDVDFMQKELISQLISVLEIAPEHISRIFFYGAGCSTIDNCNKIKKALSFHFQSDIEILHDMLGAVRATLGNQTGIVGILGTGSNCCYYDGTQITQQLVSLGYIAGDEGSGNHLGKLLLQSYCYGLMPDRFKDLFYKKYQLSRTEVTTQLFQQQRPNAYLASFSPFLKEHRSQFFVQNIIGRCFREHIEKNIFALDFPYHTKISYVGSIAYYFKEELQEVLAEYGLELDVVIQKPMDGLVRYHSH